MMKLSAAPGDDDDLRCQPDTDLQTREWIGGARSEGPCLLLEVNTGMGSQYMTLGALIFDLPCYARESNSLVRASAQEE